MRDHSLTIHVGTVLAAIAVLISQGDAGAGTSVGVLSQLSGRAGCMTREPRSDCGRLVGAESAGLGLFGDIVVSPDGRSVYVASSLSLAVLRRNVKTGALSQPSGRVACIRHEPRPYAQEKRCLPLTDFFPVAVAVAPDARSVYVASAAEDVGGGRDDLWTRFDVFRRDTHSGNLYRLSGAGTCFYDPAHSQPQPPKGCTPASGLSFPDAVAVSPDGRFVYVGSSSLYRETRGITVFRRLESGGLEQLPSVRRSAFPKGNEAVERLVLSPDGENLYAVVDGYDLIVAFDRNARTGTLTRLDGPSGCLSAAPRPDCLVVKGPRFWDHPALTASADGRYLYLTSQKSIMTIIRRVDGRLKSSRPVVKLRSSTASDIEIAPDGRTAYVLTDSGFLAYSRDTGSGALSHPRCDGSGSTPCARPRALGQYTIAAAISPDGRHAYVLGETRDFTENVTAYARRLR